MRWFHEAVDRLHVACLHRLMPRVFRHSIDSPPLSAHVAAVQLSLPARTATRYYTVTARTLVGELAAGFQVRWGPQPGLPVLVYHHGIAEMPYDKSFRGIFRGSLPAQAHLVAVQAPFHRHWFELLPGLGSWHGFLGMLHAFVPRGEGARRGVRAGGA